MTTSTEDFIFINEEPTPVVMTIQEFVNLPEYKDYLVKDIGYDWNKTHWGYSQVSARFWFYKNQKDLQNNEIAGWFADNGNPISNVCLVKGK